MHSGQTMHLEERTSTTYFQFKQFAFEVYCFPDKDVMSSGDENGGLEAFAGEGRQALWGARRSGQLARRDIA